MENKEKNTPIPTLKDEELDTVAGGVILPGQQTPPPPDRPDPYLDDPNSFTKPSHPEDDPKFF